MPSDFIIIGGGLVGVAVSYGFRWTKNFFIDEDEFREFKKFDSTYA